MVREFRLENVIETRNYSLEDIDELDLIINVLKEYNEMKEEIKNLKS